ncbi:MAG: hypothetical protein BYD32DRAFT_157771 [Podila humilis]|nr:MAG: hypothetical protein BYD32DRAFT_157771 [Podila humilis]
MVANVCVLYVCTCVCVNCMNVLKCVRVQHQFFCVLKRCTSYPHTLMDVYMPSPLNPSLVHLNCSIHTCTDYSCRTLRRSYKQTKKRHTSALLALLVQSNPFSSSYAFPLAHVRPSVRLSLCLPLLSPFRQHSLGTFQPFCFVSSSLLSFSSSSLPFAFLFFSSFLPSSSLCSPSSSFFLIRQTPSHLFFSNFFTHSHIVVDLFSIVAFFFLVHTCFLYVVLCLVVLLFFMTSVVLP